MTETRADVYSRITDQITAAVEAGAVSYRMPWHHDGTATSRPINLASGKTYRGINVLVLWAASDAHGFMQGLWGTYRQWLAVGGQVRKGERGCVVVLWKQITNGGDGDEHIEGEGHGRRAFARAFTVFNIAQIDGYTSQPVAARSEPESHANAETFIANLGISTIFGGNEACYLPSKDEIHMPHRAQFDDAASFYGVMIHECGHASGAKHRLSRDLSGRFGSEAYAAEEICAELTSGFVLADLGIAHNPRPDHAAYIASWLKALRPRCRIWPMPSGSGFGVARIFRSRHGPSSSRQSRTAACRFDAPRRYSR